MATKKTNSTSEKNKKKTTEKVAKNAAQSHAKKSAPSKKSSKTVKGSGTKKSIKKNVKKKNAKKKTTRKTTPKKTKSVKAPEVSIVIPIYNEEKIVSKSVKELIEKLAKEPAFHYAYEIILSENGSKDNTVEVVKTLTKEFPQVRLIRAGEPNYGLALRKGIEDAKADLVICDEIDLCDVDFYIRALKEITEQDYDLVVGSKALDSSRDHRPLFRKAATFTLNGLLRVFLGFHGTDTHGLKALRKSRLLKVVARCVVDKDLFASEFVIRTERMGFRSKEIPVTIAEMRPPSINLTKRVPGVLKNLGQLFWVIRVKHR